MYAIRSYYGFGFDLGAEKFFDIKCRTAGLDPEPADVLDVGLEVGDPALDRPGVGRGEVVPGGAAVELERADRGYDGRRFRPQSSYAALDVEELLRAEVP